mmetsp:Transcript_30895/g.50168  ORF Transcript_30895/g.50168 Transcript_30895/m.50168 type:complete len:235 (+) Transcript_30895:38-742(+)
MWSTVGNATFHDVPFEDDPSTEPWSHSPISVSKIILLFILILVKIVGHLSLSVVLDPKKGTILASIAWFICQCLIAWLNHLNLAMYWSSFVVLNTCTLYFLTRYICHIQAHHKLVTSMVVLELFWLITCDDISCFAAYIFIFEGCFVQRVLNEYVECKWNDKHLVIFAVSKLIFISWICISLNWIISLCEMLYFVVPVLSLRWKRVDDSWFLMDGCSHISFFCFWWLSSTIFAI